MYHSIKVPQAVSFFIVSVYTWPLHTKALQQRTAEATSTGWIQVVSNQHCCMEETHNGTFGSREIQMELYIPIFFSNHRTLYAVFPRLASIAMCRFISLLVCPAPQGVVFPKRNQIICKGRTLVRKRRAGVEIHLLTIEVTMDILKSRKWYLKLKRVCCQRY